MLRLVLHRRILFDLREQVGLEYVHVEVDHEGRKRNNLEGESSPCLLRRLNHELTLDRFEVRFHKVKSVVPIRMLN